MTYISRRDPLPESGPCQVETSAHDSASLEVSYGTHWVPLRRLLEWIECERQKIPESLRDTAEIHFSLYDDRVDSLSMEYLRPETPKEYEQRMAEDRRYDEEQKRRDRAEFERLKQKLGE